MVFVTHDLDEAIYLADRVLVLGGEPARITLQQSTRLCRPRDQIRTVGPVPARPPTARGAAVGGATVRTLRRAAPRAVGLVVPLGVLLAWQLLSATGLLRLQFLPSPDRIARTLVEEALTGELVADLTHTLAVVAAATGIAAMLGGGVGAALGLLPALRRRVLASVDFLRAVSAIALMPVALLALGPRPLTELMLATYAATWPVLVNTLGGVVGVPERLRDVAATLRLRPASTLARVTIPASVPAWLG